MNWKSVKTHWVKIYLAGPQHVIEQVCRKYCRLVGLCVTVEPTRFIYTGGEETGCVVGLINYPRFPSDPESLESKAKELAGMLLEETCQDSVLIMDPDKTYWHSRRNM